MAVLGGWVFLMSEVPLYGPAVPRRGDPVFSRDWVIEKGAFHVVPKHPPCIMIQLHHFQQQRGVGIWALRAPKWMYLRGISESTLDAS